MKPMKSAAYLRAKGGVCPYCRSVEIEGMSTIQAEGTTAWQRIECSACQRDWVDIYELTGYEPANTGEQRATA